MENPSQRFKRIAEYRVKRLLNDIRILGNCANRQAYAYTDEQVEKIFKTILERLDAIKTKFASDKKEIDFTL